MLESKIDAAVARRGDPLKGFLDRVDSKKLGELFADALSTVSELDRWKRAYADLFSAFGTLVDGVRRSGCAEKVGSFLEEDRLAKIRSDEILAELKTHKE